MGPGLPETGLIEKIFRGELMQESHSCTIPPAIIMTHSIICQGFRSPSPHPHSEKIEKMTDNEMSIIITVRL